MKKIWFIRHGESEANVGIPTPDVINVNLTTHGRMQAENVSLEFTRAPDFIVASPFVRTQQTAEPTRKRFPHIPYEIWGVQEFTYLPPDAIPNSTHAEREPMRTIYWNKCDPDYIFGNGAESFNMIIERIDEMFERINSHKSEFFAIFTHGLFLKIMVFYLRYPELSRKELLAEVNSKFKCLEIGNCNIIKAEISDGKVEITDGVKMSC